MSEAYVQQELQKYPYRTNQGTPFRLQKNGEHSWDVFECYSEMEYGHFVGFRELQDSFDDCDTEEQAKEYWIQQS